MDMDLRLGIGSRTVDDDGYVYVWVVVVGGVEEVAAGWLLYIVSQCDANSHLEP